MEHKYVKPKKKKSVGKKLCIFFLVIFTLVMIADVANFFLTPARGQMGIGPGGGNFSMPEFTSPEGGEMPSGDFQMPEGSDFQMPSGDFQMPEGGGFQRPEGGGMPGGDAFSGGFTPGEEGGEMPPFGGEAPSFDGMSGGSRGGMGGGFLQMLRSAWLPILIVCILGDLVCVAILARIRRKEKALAQAYGNESGLPPLVEDEDSDEPPPKRKRGPWVLLLCLAMIFAMILTMFPTGEEMTSSADVHQELISGSAEAAQIQTVLSGAGTLEADTLTPVTAPQQVTVLNYHVRNGENVKAGDPLVSVDKTSAASAVLELNKLMEALDEDLNSEKVKSQSARIASTTSGRVKKIYAQAGDKVTDVLYEHGTLMLLSLDGYMKVTFESEENLSVGDTVTVQYADGIEEGRIATVRLGKVTVTLSDEEAPYGAEATVLDESGKTIGQSKLEINSEMKIIGYYGTIESVRVTENKKVTADNTLFSLKDVGETTDYQLLLSRRSELETQLQKLTQLARTGFVYAETDGVVSGVPEDADIELLSSGSSDGWKVVLLSADVQPTTVYYAAIVTAVNGRSITVRYVEATGQTDANFDPAGYSEGISASTLTAELPVGAEQTVPAQGEYLILKATGNSTLEIVPGSGGGITPPETKLTGTYTAVLNALPGSNGLNLKVYVTQTESGTETVTDTFAYNPAIEKNDIALTENGNVTLVKLDELKAGDVLVVTLQENVVTVINSAQRTTASGQGGQMPDGTQGNLPSDGMGGMGDMSGMDGMGGGSEAAGGMQAGGSGGAMPSGGSMGGMPGGLGGTQEQTYENYVVEETQLLSISGQEEVSLTITVDELDILSLETGLDAQVTLDAMKGQSFSGTIRRIGHEGTNDGGNTKFTVTIVLPRQAAMLDGMNASVKIVTETHDAAVTIPAAALVEADGKTYVYTAYETETDTLDGMKEVETGASDGETVEILSGLSAGDPYYYRYADTVTYNFLTAI